MSNKKPPFTKECPPLGYTTRVTLERVKDGDTIRVKYERYMDVRILGADTPEYFHPKSKEEKASAIEAKSFTTKLLTEASKITIFIPSDDGQDFTDIMAMDRVGAYVFADDKNVAEELNKAGFVKNVSKPS